MQLNDPDGVESRFPGKKRIPHTKLYALGPLHELNCDGHEKLGFQALRMGVGLPIYGMKDKWADAMMWLVVVPNVRLATTIGHVFLDFIEKYGCKSRFH